jgi:cytochrome c peroxidase
MSFKALILVGLLGLLACNSSEKDTVQNEEKAFFVPADNPVTDQKVALGRHLFYEPGLSIDSSVSCASCHIQRFAFSDTARVSRGFQRDTGFRNSTSLTNAAYQTAFFRDGGVKSLERAVHPPVLTVFEMNMSPEPMVERLRQNQAYIDMFQEAFGTEPTYKGVVYALATFQREMISFNTPYDKYLAGNETALSPAAKRGLELFRSSKLNCVQCHVEPLFIDNDMHNIGIYEVYEDYGRGRVTLDSADYGKFRTPTLRNIAVTAPYMHDGSMKTLEEVIAFYESGGVDHPNKSKHMKAFELTNAQKQDLLSFLSALTDSAFLTNPALAAP